MERRDAGFLHVADLRNVSPADEQNSQPNEGRYGHDEGQGHKGVRIKNPNAGGGEAGNTDLQKPEHGRRAANIVVKG